MRILDFIQNEQEYLAACGKYQVFEECLVVHRLRADPSQQTLVDSVIADLIQLRPARSLNRYAERLRLPHQLACATIFAIANQELLDAVRPRPE
jgi:hypothetical protein